MGYLLSLPHVWHLRTSISAQGFLPFLLLFSTTVLQVSPSMRIESQNLQTVCFTVGVRRILDFNETERMSVAKRRAIPRRDPGWPFPWLSTPGPEPEPEPEPAVFAQFDETGLASWAAVKYVAACWRNETREYSALLLTSPFFPFAMGKDCRMKP